MQFRKYAFTSNLPSALLGSLTAYRGTILGQSLTFILKSKVVVDKFYYAVGVQLNSSGGLGPDDRV